MKNIVMTKKDRLLYGQKKYSKGYAAGRRKEAARINKVHAFRVMMIIAAIGLLTITLWSAAHAK